jgi:DNA polymerase V
MSNLDIIGFRPDSDCKIPMFTMSVSAGTPIPVDEEVDKVIDLNEYLVEHPAATFFARVRGSSLEEAGIRDGDVLIVDASVDPQDGRMVVASINNELMVRVYREIEDAKYLESHDKRFLPVKIEPYMEFAVMGTVTRVIHSL